MPKFDIKPPSDEQENPYIPPGPPEPLTFEEFAGINTATTRPGVDEKQMWWCDGFMPIGPQYLRTLYGVGTAIYATTSPITVSFFNFANIGSTPYAIIIRSDGAIVSVDTSVGSSSATVIAVPGSVQNPSRDNNDITQWGSDFVLFVTQQVNGYFLWDGTVFYSPTSISPVIIVTNGGSGYSSAPTVAITGGGGSGATAVATIQNGVVTEVRVTAAGLNYTSNPSVGFSGGGGSGAAATATFMPLGIQGSAIEVYAGRVWIVNGSTITFSAPGSFTDFSTGSGGGSFTSTDSFLRVRFAALKQTNGFLYLIGDSSINYISGVQTTGSPPTTTFTNQNADPEVGTPYATTVDVFGRNIIFANAFGAHVSYGAAVTKVSSALDGIFNSVSAPNFGGFIPSAAKAIVFGKKLWMLLIPVINPISGQQENKLFMWDGERWWASGQDVNLVYIQHQEIDSILTAYGTDGTSLYPLFQTPSTALQKIVQSKLWSKPGYLLGKAATRLWGMVQYYSILAPTLTVDIDNETTAATAALALGPLTVTWTTALGLTMLWTTATGDPMTWRASGVGILVIEPTAIGQQGALLGITATTNSADMAIISLAIDAKIVQYRG